MSETITAYVPCSSYLKDVEPVRNDKVELNSDRNIVQASPRLDEYTNAIEPKGYSFNDCIPWSNPVQEDFPLPPEVIDMVNHPSHYALEKYECKEVLKEVLKDLDGYEGFCIGNVIKYCWRLKRKGKPVEDAKKAAFYINDCIEYMKAKEKSKCATQNS